MIGFSGKATLLIGAGRADPAGASGCYRAGRLKQVIHIANLRLAQTRPEKCCATGTADDSNH
jgi:hypothetical protein